MKWYWKFFFRQCPAVYSASGWHESKHHRCHLPDNHEGLHGSIYKNRLVEWSNTIVRVVEE